MEIPRFIVYNLRQVGHMHKRNREQGKWREGKREEEEGLRVRCEFVGGPDGSALLTDSKPSGRGEEVLHDPLESSTSSSQSSRLETLPLFARGKVGLRVG